MECGGERLVPEAPLDGLCVVGVDADFVFGERVGLAGILKPSLGLFRAAPAVCVGIRCDTNTFEMGPSL